MSDTHAQRAEQTTRTPGRVRRIAFFVIAVLTLALFVALVPPDVTHPVTGWLPADQYEPYIELFYGAETPANMDAHRHHMLGFSVIVWLVLVGVGVQLRRPERKHAPIWAAAATVIVALVVEIAIMGFDSSSLVFVAPVLGVLALHPRRLPEGGFSWSGPAPGRLLAIAMAASAVVYAAGEIRLQLLNIPGDVHAVDGHYTITATAALALAITAVLGTSNLAGARIAAWTTGLIATLIGAFFIAFPTTPSSAGIAWGTVTVLLGLGYLLTTGQSRPVAPLTPGRVQYDVTR